MKYLSILILIQIPVSVFAQTEKVTRDVRTKGIKEKFYVLTSDTNIKEGSYGAYSRYGGRPLCEGFYKNNVRDSIWSSYDYEGKLEVKYDYTHKRLLAYDPPKFVKEISQFNVINGKDTLRTSLDQPPILVDGTGKLIRLYITATRYPAIAKENNIQGKVIVAITIDTLGNPSNYRIKNSIGGGCDEEALRVTKLFEGGWIPGMLNGKPVSCEYEMPLSFTLQKN